MGLLLPVKFLRFPVRSAEENRQMPESTKEQKLWYPRQKPRPGLKQWSRALACFRVTWKACLHIGAAVQHRHF